MDGWHLSPCGVKGEGGFSRECLRQLPGPRSLRPAAKGTFAQEIFGLSTTSRKKQSIFSQVCLIADILDESYDPFNTILGSHAFGLSRARGGAYCTICSFKKRARDPP
jgi:hypothetical protein